MNVDSFNVPIIATPKHLLNITFSFSFKSLSCVWDLVICSPFSINFSVTQEKASGRQYWHSTDLWRIFQKIFAFVTEHKCSTSNRWWKPELKKTQKRIIKYWIATQIFLQTIMLLYLRGLAARFQTYVCVHFLRLKLLGKQGFALCLHLFLFCQSQSILQDEYTF